MAISGRTVRTPEKGDRLLAKLAQGYSVAAACRAEKIGRTADDGWRQADPAFAARADAAIEEGTDRLEDEARRRATLKDGASDTLLIFLLKARRPETYRERHAIEHTGAGGGELVIRYVNDWRAPLAPPPPASNPSGDTTQGR
jgi:hypothetical protein